MRTSQGNRLRWIAPGREAPPELPSLFRRTRLAYVFLPLMPCDYRFGDKKRAERDRRRAHECAEQQVPTNVHDVHPTSPVNSLPLGLEQRWRPVMRLGQK